MSVFLSNIYLLKPQTSSLHQPTIISRLRLKCVYKFLKISLLLSWSGDTFSDSHCQIHHKLTKYYMCTTQLTTSVFFFCFVLMLLFFFFWDQAMFHTKLSCDAMMSVTCQLQQNFTQLSHFPNRKKKTHQFQLPRRSFRTFLHLKLCIMGYDCWGKKNQMNWYVTFVSGNKGIISADYTIDLLQSLQVW